MRVTDTAAEAPFQLSLPGFDGSVEALLGLVQCRQLELTELPLARITGQFNSYLQETESVDLQEVGEFVRSAALLLAMKSERLLPQPEVETIEEEEREERAWQQIEGLPEVVSFLVERQEFSSFASLPRMDMFTRPVEPAPVSGLRRAWKEMTARSLAVQARVAAPPFLRLETALSGLIRRLRTGARVRLQQLLRGSSRQDAVVHFLAVLELARRRQASVEQEQLFGDIFVEWQEHAAADEQCRAG